MSTAERPPTPPDESEHDSDTCSTDSYRADPSSDSDRGRAALMKQQVRRPRTNLLSLPPELHYEIFKHLENDKAGKRPICRALWPISRRNAFRVVSISRPKRVQRFASLLGLMHRMYKDPSLLQEVRQTGSLIRRLSLSTRPAKSSPKISTVSRRHPSDPISVAPVSDIHTILSQATRVKSLTLYGPQALEYLVPAKSRLAWLPELEELTLSDLAGPGRHWTSEIISRLRRFPRLKELDIELSHPGELATSRSASPATMHPIPQVTCLRIQIDEPVVPADVARCVALFSGIRELVVNIEDLLLDEAANDRDETIDLGDVLQAVPASRLSKLIISADSDDIDPEDAETGPGLTTEADLARFHRLTHLSLCYKTFHRAGELFDLLAKHVSQLQHLTLSRYAYVSATRLLSFVRQRGGPSRALKELQCDIFFGSVYPSRVPSKIPEDPMVMDGTFELVEWWELPLWQFDFTFARARELVEAGQEVGVRITGDLPDAIGTETARVREQAFLDERRDEFLYHDLSSLFGSE